MTYPNADKAATRIEATPAVNIVLIRRIAGQIVEGLLARGKNIGHKYINI
jgi:hypothetical protein